MSKTKPYLDANPADMGYCLKLRQSSNTMGVREMQRLQKQSWRKKTRAYKMNNMRTSK